MGKNLVFVPECHSTNSLAVELSQQQVQPEGTVVITDHQTTGRGQRGNGWEANPGENLTFSVIVNPGFLKVNEQFSLTQITSLAVCDYLHDRLNTTIKIKWPNDIMVGSKKICGILIENSLSGENLQNSVLGIGLNVNQEIFSLPSPTSMRQITGRWYEPGTELERLLETLEKRYLQLRSAQVPSLGKEYLERMYWLNEKRIFASQSGEFEGVIKGVDELGLLKIETDARELAFDLKEIRFVR